MFIPSFHFSAQPTPSQLSISNGAFPWDALVSGTPCPHSRSRVRESRGKPLWPKNLLILIMPFDIINLAQRNTFQQPFTEAGNPRSTPLLTFVVLFAQKRMPHLCKNLLETPCSKLVCLEEDTPKCRGASLSPAEPIEPIAPTTVIGLGMST